MAEDREFVVERTADKVYLDEGNNPVTGFEVTIRLIDFGELHTLDVPNLRPDTVAAAAEALLEDRKALADLGS